MIYKISEGRQPSERISSSYLPRSVLQKSKTSQRYQGKQSSSSWRLFHSISSCSVTKRVGSPDLHVGRSKGQAKMSDVKSDKHICKSGK